MSYAMNPAAWGAMFPVPAQIADTFLRLATGEQLKVLLWILRHSPENPDLFTLCKDLKMQAGDVEDYLMFWVQQGILNKAGEPQIHAPAPEAPPPAPESKPKAKELPELPETKPSSEQIAARCEESQEIRYLFQHAQEKLGRTIGYDGQCSLLMMHDQYGLPIEVILMLLEYAASIGKTSMLYIGAVGRDWGTREIDSIEKADEQITALRGCNSLWKRFAAIAGLANPRPTAAQSEYLRQWHSWGMAAEALYLAYEKMVNAVQRVSFSYMHKILIEWHENGIRSEEDAQAYLEKKKEERKPKQTGKAAASYDLEKFKQKAIHIPAAYRKKEE